MNRRSFIGVIVTSACCGGRSAPRPPTGHDHAPLPTTTDPYATYSPDEPPDIVAHGEVLIQRVGTQQWKWDLVTMRRVDVYGFDDPVVAFTFLTNGSLALLTSGTGSCAIHRIDSNGQLQTFVRRDCGPMSRPPPRLFTGATPDTVYVLEDEDFDLLGFAGMQLERIRSEPFPRAFHPRRGHAFSLDDGRVVTIGDGTIEIVPHTTPTTSLGSRYLRLLARASNGRVWYAYEKPKAWGITGLVLAELDKPTTEVAAIDVAPARMVRMSSHGAMIAVLLVTRDATWSLAVFDESGKERWRVSLPEELTGHFDLAKVAALAVTDRLVVLRGLADRLVAWNTNTGASVSVENPS